MKRWLPLLFLLPLTSQASIECKGLVKELEGMRQAQQVMLVSLASNHEVFASSVEDITAELQLSSKKVPNKTLKSMNKTAQAFRIRGLKAKRQAEQLDEATADLIERVALCLSK